MSVQPAQSPAPTMSSRLWVVPGHEGDLMYRLATLLLLLCCCFGRVASAEIVDASICDVLANPASFDGKVIRITGATAVARFDEFVVEGSGCQPPAALWLAYPEGTKGKAGPTALVRLQLASNSSLVPVAPTRAPVTLQRDSAFKRFDSLMAEPHKSSALCLGCPRNSVSATLVGRLDGVSVAGLLRDANGKPTGLAGFGNMNLYRARLVLQAVSDVVPHEIDYSSSATPVRGDSRRTAAADPAQVKRAAAALGEPGEQNGVEVDFGAVSEMPFDEGSKGSSASPDGVLFHAMFDMSRLGKQALSKAIAHMGSHIADIRGGSITQGPDEAESRAWQATFGD